MSVLNSLPQPTAGDSAKVPSRPALRIGPLSLVLRPFMIVVNVPCWCCSSCSCASASAAATSRCRSRGHQRPLRRRLQGAAVHRHGSAPPASVGRGPDRHRARHLRSHHQSIARNALASPDILGITSGASAAAVALIVLGGGGSFVGLLATLGIPLAALAGGLLTAAVIYLLAWRNGVEGYRLILIGIGINAMLIAVTGWLLISADINDVSRAKVWLNGSINGADGARVAGGDRASDHRRLGDHRDVHPRSTAPRRRQRPLARRPAAVRTGEAATRVGDPRGRGHRCRRPGRFRRARRPQVAMRLVRSPARRSSRRRSPARCWSSAATSSPARSCPSNCPSAS